jgi:hypothetical protein
LYGHLVEFHPFGTFYDHLVHFHPFWYVVPRKIWQPWSELARDLISLAGKLKLVCDKKSFDVIFLVATTKILAVWSSSPPTEQKIPGSNLARV